MTTPQTTPELLPCPFCGSADTYAMDMGGWESFCKKCGTNGPALNTEREKVIADWNARAATPRVTAAPVEGVSYADFQQRKGAPLTFFSGIAADAYAAAATRDDVSHRQAMETALQAVEDARSLGAPASPQPLAPPPGYAVVPQPITEEMHVAAVKVLHRAHGVDGLPQRMLDAMVAAAPQPPASVQPLAVGVETELEEMRQRKDAAYLERNQVVAALAKCFPSGVGRTAIEGWSEDWHCCVYIDLPTGQASWHFHDSQAYLFAGLPKYHGSWDGHDTPEKYRRLAALPLPEQCTSDNPQTCWRVRCNLGNSCVAASPQPPVGMVPLTEPEEWDFWDVVGLRCAGYNSAIDADLIGVFIESATEGRWYADTAKRLGLQENYVELLKEILCSADFCEYGTSPRGAWAIDATFADNLAKLKVWYFSKWGHEFTPEAGITPSGIEEQRDGT